jgi:hypothetical protein
MKLQPAGDAQRRPQWVSRTRRRWFHDKLSARGNVKSARPSHPFTDRASPAVLAVLGKQRVEDVLGGELGP